MEAAAEIAAKKFIDAEVFFYSADCDENINRRFLTPDNRCSFLPHRRDMERIADGICDKELGVLLFIDKATNQPAYIVGNYAAHPLAGHAPGIGGHRISADYPGAFRTYIESETGAGAMFLSGAAGNMVPRGHELGADAIQRVGISLARAAIDGAICAMRDRKSYRIASETLESTIEKVSVPIRKIAKMPPDYKGQKTVELEIQAVSIGDVCLLGVPGELLAELGLEMKWHSPFRKTFILYCSTAYFTYLCHGNALVSGGYEANSQWMGMRGGLALVNTAVDAAHKLYDRAFPEEEKHPDNAVTPLVALRNTAEV